MATSIVAKVAKAAYFFLVFVSIISAVSAQTATTSTLTDLPDDLDQSAMALSLSSGSGPPGVDYKVAPLTVQAGLNQTNQVTLRAFSVSGNLLVVDESNYNTVNESDIKDTITYLSCDPSADDSYLTPNDVLNSMMAKQPKAILMFSTTGTCCSLTGSDLPFTSIWTMTDPQEAWETKNRTADSVIRATISGGTAAVNSDAGRSQGGNNSAVAMSILYSITGLITLLFLVIIATGAIRAHRHPERYGPRASYGGRPRQSRARGLARAVLETLPIVKFGDPQPAKPDPENELESVSGDRQQHLSSSAQRNSASNDTQQQGPSPETAAKAASESISEVPNATMPDAAAANYGQTEDDHLGCSICTEDFTVGQDVRVLPCDHKFHPQCIDPWLVNVSGTCPLCRLDLRPQEEGEEGEGSWPSIHPDTTSHGPAESHLAPPPEDEGDVSQRRRRSRLLDWNRLRHAPVDERIQALRQYRQSQGATSGNGSAEDQNRHAKLSDRLREKFHIRTRAHPSGGSPSTSQ